MRTKLMLWLILVVLILTVPVSQVSALSIAGTLESQVSSTLEDPYELKGQAELYLNLDSFFGDSAMHVGVMAGSAFPTNDDANVIDLDEAYVDYYGTDFDLRFGKQRIVWGTAMQMNPTDVINPPSPQDPLGDKQAILAAELDYYFGNYYKLTGVWVPFFQPAVNQIKPPDATLKESEYALKLSATGLHGIDVSVSYFRGKEDMPTPMIMGGIPMPVYRDVRIFGADMATTVGDFGLWAEGAYIVPDEGDNYYHVIAGTDYSFANGLVLLGQYYHRTDQRGDFNYLIMAAEKDFASIHGARVGVMYNFESGSAMLSPEVTFSLADATSLVIGAKYFKNEGEGLGLPFMMPNSHAYVGLQMSF